MCISLFKVNILISHIIRYLHWYGITYPAITNSLCCSDWITSSISSFIYSTKSCIWTCNGKCLNVTKFPYYYMPHTFIDSAVLCAYYKNGYKICVFIILLTYIQIESYAANVITAWTYLIFVVSACICRPRRLVDISVIYWRRSRGCEYNCVDDKKKQIYQYYDCANHAINIIVNRH